MKKHLFWLLLCCICPFVVAQNVQVSENSFEKVSVTFTPGSLSVENVSLPQGNFSRITMDGFDVSNNPGAPSLPMLTKLLQIPVCDSVVATIVEAQYTDYAAADLGITQLLFPSQPSQSKSDSNPQFAYNQTIYSTNAFYALPLVRVEKAGVRRGLALANVYLSPVQYNPVTQTVRIYSQIEVEFSFVNTDMTMTERIQRDDSPLFTLTNDLVINKMEEAPKAEFANSPIKYLIVANSMFSTNTDLAAFVAWKRRLGYLVEVAYTSEANVGTTTTSIKNYIQNCYNNATADNPAPTFLLLIGDVAQLPAFTGVSDNDHVTDLYYATLAGNDNIPDCYYGRLSATNNSHLSNQITKIMMYESYTMPDPSYLGKAVLIAGTDANGYSTTHADGQINYAYNNYINTNSTTHNYTTVYKHNYNCSSQAATIRSEINAGVGFANYTAHGSSSGWADPSFSNTHVSSMTNTDKYGLLIGNCCLSGKFDDSSCFGETLLRAAEKGAMGYIGASNSSYWSEDVYWSVGVRSNINASMSYNASNLGVYDKMFHTHNEAQSTWVSTIGGIVQGGNMAVQSSSSSRKLYYWEIYHCFGDPSVRVFLGMPSQMTVVADSVITGDTLVYPSQVAPYAYVALTSGGNLVAAAFADANGMVNLPLPETLMPGELELVALAQNYIPYFQPVMVTEGSGVTCFRPLHLTCTELTGSSATLSWTEFGNATDWVLQYSTDETFDTYSEVNVNGTPTTALACLTSGNTYYARVKSDCGDTNGVSQWSAVCSFLPLSFETVEVGNGTTTSQYLPSYSYYKYELSQQLYTPAELGEAGVISSIAFYNGGEEETRTYDLYLVSTTKTAFSSSTDWIPVTNADKVFSGTVTMAADEWISFPFDTPFEYDGSSNLALIVDDNTGAYTSSPHMSCKVFDGNSNCAIYKYSDNTNYDPFAPGNTSGTRVNVKNQIRMNISYPNSGEASYLTISGNTSVCPGETTTLTVNTDGEGAYTWSTGATGSQIQVGEGTYTVTMTTSTCGELSDSVTVVANPVYAVSDAKTVCENELPYTWNGVTFTAAGTQDCTLPTVDGCDSVVTMTLTLKNVSHSEFTEETCYSYLWNDVTYNQSGDYTQTFATAEGCDSVVTLHLTINNDVSSEYDIVTTDSCYEWNDQLYCATGDYTQTFTSADGCDSVVTLHLTITVGIEDYDGFASVYLAPNPAKNLCRIMGLRTTSCYVDVYDMRGRLLLRSTGPEFDVSDLSRGVYMVKVSENERVFNLKLLKQ